MISRLASSLVLLSLAAAPAIAAPVWSASNSGSVIDLVGLWGSSKENVFAASNDGSVLRSTDGGKSWVRHATPTTKLVGITGSGSENLYVMGSELAHSSDGGVTWTTTPVKIDQPNAIWSPGGDDIFVVGSDGAIRHSLDAGKTWEAPESGTGNGLNAIWGSSAEDVYAAGDSGALVHSSDGGKTWAAETSGVSVNLDSIMGLSATDVYAVGGEQVIHSTDGGATWKSIWSTKGLGSYTRVFCSAKKDVWVVGTKNLLHASDGKSFTNSKSGTELAIRAIWGSGADDVYMASERGLILHNSGKGKPWEVKHGLRAPGVEVLRGAWGAVGDWYVVGYLRIDGTKPSFAGEILRSDDNGATLTPVHTSEGSALEAIWGAGRGDLYAVGGGGTILHATDGGRTWKSLTSGTKSGLRAVWGSGAGDVYAVGEKGTILHSEDNGQKWVAQKSGTKLNLSAIWGVHSEDIYVAGNGENNACGILHSTDKGKTWKSVYDGAGSLNALGGAGPKELYAVGNDDSYKSQILSSTDGAKWNSSSMGPGIPRSMIVLSAGNLLIAGGSGVVWRSIDAGKTFTEEKTNVTADLESLFVDTDERLMVVGQSGMVLRTANK